MSSILQRDNLTDALTREIQCMILKGEVAPGAWLPPQPELARRFGVGLSTVREAIKSLTLLGVVKPQPGRGTQVTPEALSILRMFRLIRGRLKEMEVLKIYEARKLIEVELARLAAQRATQEDIARMEEALSRMQQAMDDDEAFTEADLEFHLAVAQAGQNQLLEGFYHIAREMLSELIREIIKIPGVKEKGLQEQAKVVEAIRARDPEAARGYAEVVMNNLGTYISASLYLNQGRNPSEQNEQKRSA